MITISIDTSKFDKVLADFPERMAAAKRNALEEIGAAVASRTVQAFRSEPIRPSPWAPRKPSKRDDGHQLLIKSGALRQSINWKLEGDDAVAVGSDKEYAPYHQTGTQYMPARPFFPVDKFGRLLPAIDRKINRIVEKAYSEELENTLNATH